MKVDLRSQHDLGEIVGYSYRIYLRNFWPLLGVALITVPLPMLQAVLEARIAGDDPLILLVLPILLANFAVSIIATGALVHMVDQVASGVPPQSGGAIDIAFARFGALLTSNLLASTLAVLSLIFFPYFVVRWMFFPQAVIIEGKRNWAALDASSSIVKDAWWRTAGIILVVFFIAMGPLLLASAAAALPVLPATTILAVAAALALPFVICAQTLLYFDLKARKYVHASTD